MKALQHIAVHEHGNELKIKFSLSSYFFFGYHCITIKQIKITFCPLKNFNLDLMRYIFTRFYIFSLPHLCLANLLILIRIRGAHTNRTRENISNTSV